MVHLHGHFNGSTVLLSFLIAAVSSYVALSLSGTISSSKGSARTFWMLAGSVAMGGGIWSMHFVGMLAFHLPMSLSYHPLLTALSMVSAIVASYIAFAVTAAGRRGLPRYAAAGFSMGAGIVSMHYSGMAAIRKPVVVTYDLAYVTLSVLIAVATSFTALYLFRKFMHKPGMMAWKLLCSVIMGLAVCGMHYTGMAAARFGIDSSALEGMTLNGAASGPNGFVMTAVAGAAFLLLALAWGAIALDKSVLERMAFYDPLTGLLNRHSLVRYFDHTFVVRKQGYLLFLDLDRFKTINDTLGHDTGDRYISEVAERLKDTLGPSDTAFRLGGDEFLIVSAGGTEEDARALAERLLDAVRRPFSASGTEFHLTASLGISLAPQHGTDRTSLMKAADLAMYKAKSAGKNRYMVFDIQSDRQNIRKLMLERDLRTALDAGELLIHYQPKWNAALGRLAGLEALLRWQHPRLGMISPGEFIPIAEENGIIVPITRWMLQEVCRQNRSWRDTGVIQVCVSVNMSVRLFESGQLHDMVADALGAFSIPPPELELEITESIAMQDIEDTIRQLKRLRELGVLISMDDFGTGYSSLGTLDEIPINTLKIDQTFIRQSAIPSKQAIIGTIIAIANHLQLEVVAEGVETEEQIRFLRSHGCHVMQGYYYGKPMDAGSLQNWVAAS